MKTITITLIRDKDHEQLRELLNKGWRITDGWKLHSGALYVFVTGESE